MKTTIFFILALSICLVTVSVNSLVTNYAVREHSKMIKELTTRIDHLYTEQGQREMKCAAKSGEWKTWYYTRKELPTDDNDSDYERTGCYSTKAEQVKIEI